MRRAHWILWGWSRAYYSNPEGELQPNHRGKATTVCGWCNMEVWEPGLELINAILKGGIQLLCPPPTQWTGQQANAPGIKYSVVTRNQKISCFPNIKPWTNKDIPHRKKTVSMPRDREELQDVHRELKRKLREAKNCSRGRTEDKERQNNTEEEDHLPSTQCLQHHPAPPGDALMWNFRLDKLLVQSQCLMLLH